MGNREGKSSLNCCCSDVFGCQSWRWRAQATAGLVGVWSEVSASSALVSHLSFLGAPRPLSLRSDSRAPSAQEMGEQERAQDPGEETVCDPQGQGLAVRAKTAGSLAKTAREPPATSPAVCDDGGRRVLPPSMASAFPNLHCSAANTRNRLHLAVDLGS